MLPCVHIIGMINCFKIQSDSFIDDDEYITICCLSIYSMLQSII